MTGSAGATGAQGLQGVQGDTAAPGLQGVPGAAGATGPQGTTGVNGAPGGPVGPTGATGPQGTAGVNGTNGTNGAPGTAGATGPEGPPGPPGGLAQYAYVYNDSAQTVPLETDITFNKNGVLTAGITHTAGTPGAAGIALVNAGDYKVTFSVSGTEPSQMALFVNGTRAPGTIYGSGAGTQQNTGQAIVTVGASAVLTLRNHSSAAAVGLATPIGGTQPSANASVAIEKLD